MAYLVYCENKGCGKHQEPALDPDTNEVLCSNCGKDIKSISSFAKRQMKAMGLVKKASPKTQVFSVNCNSCKKTATPSLKDNKLACSNCSEELKNIPKPYEHAVREYLKTQKHGSKTV